MLAFDFSGLIARWPELATGALGTLLLSLAGMVLGLTVGLLGALGRMSRSAPLRWLVGVYVELIRNTPFLVQLYIIYFGLPALGLRLTPILASLTAMALYSGAYLTEILRAGIESVPRAQSETARALGLSRVQTALLVTVPQGIAAIYPALVSQFVLLLLASSIVSAVSVHEITGAANDIQSQTFRSFETFLVVAALYIALTSAVRAALLALDRSFFAYRVAAR